VSARCPDDSEGDSAADASRSDRSRGSGGARAKHAAPSWIGYRASQAGHPSQPSITFRPRSSSTTATSPWSAPSSCRGRHTGQTRTSASSINRGAPRRGPGSRRRSRLSRR
jgi:hypothetical protein